MITEKTDWEILYISEDIKATYTFLLWEETTGNSTHSMYNLKLCNCENIALCDSTASC